EIVHWPCWSLVMPYFHRSIHERSLDYHLTLALCLRAASRRTSLDDVGRSGLRLAARRTPSVMLRDTRSRSARFAAKSTPCLARYLRVNSSRSAALPPAAWTSRNSLSAAGTRPLGEPAELLFSPWKAGLT